MASNFGVDGLISGFKTSDIIQSLMAVERRPLLALQRQKAQEEARKGAWSAIRTSFTTLQSAVQNLTLRATANAKGAITNTPTTSPTILVATASADAAVGTFTVDVDRLATATVSSSGAAIGQAVNPTAMLKDAGFATTVDTSQLNGADRYFTINGVRITADADDKLYDPADAANSMVHKIQSSLGAGWTVDLVPDSAGRAANSLRIVAPSGTTINAGAGDDTSNFLRSVNLLGADPGTTGGLPSLTSTAPLAWTNVSAGIGTTSARLATPLTGLTPSGAGAFKVNGVQIDFSATDSLNTIISRINSSSAGVQASYDPLTDRLRLTNVALGGRAITLENATINEGGVDYTSNFLDAVGLAAPSTTLGQTALYRINGGPQQSTDSNTVTGAVPGVTLDLKSVSTAPVTVTVSQDIDKTKKALEEFVSAFNGVLDTIARQTAYNLTTKEGSPLTGDSTVRSLERQLRSLVSTPAVGVTGSYQTLADIGVSTGAIGSAVGTTKQLKLDQAKLEAALRDNPQAVESVLAGFINSASGLSGAGNITAISGAPSAMFESGTYKITFAGDGSGNADVTFTNDAGQVVETRSVVFAAGAANTAVVQGMTLTTTGAGFTPSGQDTFAVTVSQRGVMVRLKSELSRALGTNGVFATRDQGALDSSRRVDERIRAMEARLQQKEKALYRRFSALEAALARSQAQSASLGASLAKLGSGA